MHYYLITVMIIMRNTKNKTATNTLPLLAEIRSHGQPRLCQYIFYVTRRGS